MDTTVLYVRDAAVADGAWTDAGGFETVTATDAAGAATILAERTVDCVVVSNRTASGSGLDAVEAVRDRDGEVPVLFCSHAADGELAAAATRRGATEYHARDGAAVDLLDRVRIHLDGGAAVGRTGTETASPAVEGSRVAGAEDLERYRTVIENIQEMVYVVDDTERFTLVTEPLAEWLGYDRAALLGSHPREVLAAGEVERFEALIAELWDVREAGESRRLETELVDADGEHRPAEVEVSLYPTDDAFAGTVGVVRDRSELVETRERLESQRDRFSYLFDNLPDAVVEGELDEDGHPIVQDVNEAFTDVFGYDPETIVGEPLNDLILPADARDEGRRLDRRAAEGDVTNHEVRRLTADGFRDFLFRGIAFERGTDGTYAFGIYTDITAQKERERRLEVLNRVLRHNLRNDLNVVLGHAEILADGLDDGELAGRAQALREKAAGLASLSDRARSIDETIGRGSPRNSTVGLTTVVEKVSREYESSHPSLTVDMAVQDVRVVGDGRLRIAVRELLENAVEHAGPSVHVRVTSERSDREVRVRVADDGPGIPEDERELVDGSTEITQLRHGSGLGLWVVKWVCESCGGRLQFAESDLGGACVVLSLSPA